MILIDFSEILHNTIFSIKDDFIENGISEYFNVYKHRVIVKILQYYRKYSSEKEIVLCADSKNSWRKDFFKYYKGRRALKRKDDDFDWSTFWENMNKFEEEIINYFPFNYIKIDRAEGDDIIGTLVYYILKVEQFEKIIIISSDKDFKQLHINNRVVQYSPKLKKEIRGINYKGELMWLILSGDNADDVLNVKTTDPDTFINENKRQLTMWRSKKVWEHINNNTVMDELLVDIVDKKTKKVIVSREQLLKNFKRNQKLVDLTKVPKQIKMDIITRYEDNRESLSNRNINTLLKYFINNKMRVLFQDIDKFSPFFNFYNKSNNNPLDNFIK